MSVASCSCPTRSHGCDMPTVELSKIESQALAVISNWEFCMRASIGVCGVMCSDSSDWQRSVPYYILVAVVQGYLGLETPLDEALHNLERFDLIEQSPPGYCKLLWGRWRLRNGREIETRRDGDSWDLDVYIDARRVFGLCGRPDLKLMATPYRCYRLSSAGAAVLRTHHAPPGDSSKDSLDDLDQAAAEDFPNPSAPMSKKNAADAWGGEMTEKKLTNLMKRHRVRFRELNRETFIFCLDDMPGFGRRP